MSAIFGAIHYNRHVLSFKGLLLMSSTHLTKEAAGLAKSVLLEPFGLDEPALLRAIGGIFTHQVDYADLYFQFTKNESCSL